MLKYKQSEIDTKISKAANIKSTCIRALAWIIKYPKPSDEPTHSPTTAPIGATETAIRKPEAKAGKAAGNRTLSNKRKGKC